MSTRIVHPPLKAFHRGVVETATAGLVVLGGAGPRPEEPLPAIIPPRREFRCPVCGAEFASRSQLDEHERAEHQEP